MTESNIFFGTAFPEQTERDKRIGVSDAGQFVPVWKQEARDEKGRRRFHGAFTGGFSAGYFNTVGSKEGWAPSQFVSSRSSRNEQRTAKPEDFMDEEDLQELASSKRLVATEEFDILGGTERELLKRKQIEEEGQKNGLSFLSTSLMDLVTPTKDSIGMTLLKKMGWKPGQGIGPRILQSIDNDNDEQMVSLAPKDTPIVEYKQKTNVYGLGYDLISNVPQVAEMYRYQQLKKEQNDEGNHSKKRKGRMGFGVGIFEDEDEDIMDYNLNDNDDDDYIDKNFHRTLYDDEDDQFNGYANIMKSKRNNNNDDLKKKRCSDGHLPLKGFHVATKPQELGRWFEPPKVPSNFDGLHKSTVKKATTTAGSNKGVELTMDARGALLGETPIEPRSVFDYMSQKSKEQLEKAKAFSSSTIEPVPFINTSKLQVTLIPANTAQLALKGFIPFGDQPEKQTRYKQYLELCVKKSNSSSSSSLDNEIETDIPKGLTHESGMKEIDEFIKAARIFRPISSMMSNRFTSASSNNQHSLSNQGGKVEHISFEGGLKTEEQYRKEKELKQKLIDDVPKPKLSQEAEAAAMNMYGPLTRKVKPFYPNRLLCKRFNIKNPHPDYIHQTSGHRTQAGSTNILNDQMMQSMFQQQQNVDSSEKKQPIGFLNVNENDPALKLVIDKPSMRKNNEQNEMDSTVKEDNKNDDNEEEEDKKLDYERPAMDIFKAIFNDDSGGSDDSEEEEDDNDNEKNQLYKSSFSKTITSTNTLEEKEPYHTKFNNNNNEKEINEDSFIGPPIPPSSSSNYSDHSKVESNIPFKPKFIKRENQTIANATTTTTFHSTISDEKIHVTTPFQPRLTSSKAPKRRHVQVTSDNDESDDSKSFTSDSNHSDHDHHSSTRHQKSKHSRKHKYDDKDRSHKHKRKHGRKKKKRSRKYSDSEDSEDEERRRSSKKTKKSKERDDLDNNGLEEKRRKHRSSTSSSSSRHKRKSEKEEHHHRSYKEKVDDIVLEDDISMWEEKKPVLKRSRAEDLW